MQKKPSLYLVPINVMSPFEAGGVCCPPPGLPTVHLVHLLCRIFSVVGSVSSVSQEWGGMERGQEGGSQIRKKKQQKQNSDRVVSCTPDIRDRKTFLMATHMGKVSPCLHSPLEPSSSPSGFLSFLAKRNVFLSFFEISLILF